MGHFPGGGEERLEPMYDVESLILSPGGDASGAAGGYGDLVGIWNESSSFMKALTGSGGTDHAGLTGGAALRRESLEATLLTVVEDLKHLSLWKKTAKSPATALVDEWSRMVSRGGFWEGGGAQAELDAILESTGVYERKTDFVKFLAARRSVGVAAEHQAKQGLGSAIGRETKNGTVELVRTANWLGFFGRADCSPHEYNGLQKILEDLGYFTDMRGKPLGGKVEPVQNAAARISGLDHFGELTDYFCSNLVQADLDRTLDPAQRVQMGERNTDLRLGAAVNGIHTSYGDILKNTDPFLVESLAPWVARGGNFTALIANAGVVPPTSVAAVAAADAASQFTADHAGTFYWAVEAANRSGRCGTLRKTNATVVAAGDKVTLSITEDPTEDGTYYVIYRSRRNGTNQNGDLREMTRIPRAGTGTTTYVDYNQDIPGTSRMFLVENTEDALVFRRFLPMTRFPLYPTNKPEYPWAQLLFLYLRVALPEHHHIIKNILPSGATWNPF